MPFTWTGTSQAWKRPDHWYIQASHLPQQQGHCHLFPGHSRPYILNKVSQFCQDSLDYIHPIYNSQVAWITDINYQTKLIDRDEVSLIFCQGWPWTMMLTIFASWVAGNADMSHHTRPYAQYMLYVSFKI
jgi:hypothetical protein